MHTHTIFSIPEVLEIPVAQTVSLLIQLTPFLDFYLTHSKQLSLFAAEDTFISPWYYRKSETVQTNWDNSKKSSDKPLQRMVAVTVRKQSNVNLKKK